MPLDITTHDPFKSPTMNNTSMYHFKGESYTSVQAYYSDTFWKVHVGNYV